MDKIIKFMKAHRDVLAIGIIIIIIVVMVVPLFINFAFSRPAKCSFFAVNWDAKDALAYYGSVLGFLGTVIFSALALWQNHEIQKVNKSYSQLLTQMEIAKNAPHIIAEHLSSSGSGGSHLQMSIKNTSENIAENLYASGFAIVDETGAAQWRYREEVVSIEYLSNKKPWEIKLDNPEMDKAKHKFVFDLKYSDKFGNHYFCKAVGSFGKQSKKILFKLTEL